MLYNLSAVVWTGSNSTNAGGAYPNGSLLLVGTTLYGTTSQGGNDDYGTVFTINTDGGDFAVLKVFSVSDGSYPYPRAGLVLSGASLYGTTDGGGSLSSGVLFSLSLLPTIITSPQTQTAEAGTTVQVAVHAAGQPPLAYQWYFNGTNILSCTDSYLVLTNMPLSQSGAYTVVVTNNGGAVTSAPAMLSVIPPVERRIVPALTLMGQPGGYLNLQDAEALGSSPNWVTFDSVVLTNTSQWYFDLSELLPPQRFYRAWQTGSPMVLPSLDLHMVPAVTLTGSIGHSVRLDYINKYGPIDAWVTLDTVTLTNTPQLYFDTSTIGQPARLWRIVPVP